MKVSVVWFVWGLQLYSRQPYFFVPIATPRYCGGADGQKPGFQKSEHINQLPGTAKPEVVAIAHGTKVVAVGYP